MSSRNTRRGRFRSIVGAFLPLCLLVFFLTGCGGGGGGGGQGGTGVDPIEVEVGAALDVFLASLSAENLVQSMESIDPKLVYRRANPVKMEGYDAFQTYLGDFFGKAASITVELRDRGITPNGEESAIIRATLYYAYTDNTGTRKEASEFCEIVMDKIAKWRIRSFTDRDFDKGLVFPPAI